jgi:hypothetical protein
MIHLFDVNLLIALGDANHPHRTPALRFFEECVVHGWATCPLTENAFVRILGRPNYPGGLGSTREARRILQSFKAAPGFQFWPDDLSLSDSTRFPTLPPSQDLTGIYLLALAVKHGGKLATFDQRIDPALIPGGPEALHLLSA